MEIQSTKTAKSLLLLAALSAANCLPTSPEPDRSGVAVGVLLPYTGELGSVGQNLERAVIMANEHLAAAEPDPNKPPFRLIFQDTHSDPTAVAGFAAAASMIEQEAARFILGPEEPFLAESVAQNLLGDRTVAISAGAVSLDSATGVSEWFRIVPTDRNMTAALAAQMFGDGVRKLAIVHVPDRYGADFATFAAAEFEARGGQVLSRVELGSAPNSELVRTVGAMQPEAILLVAYPTGGAAFVQEWAVLGAEERWYLAPSLRSEFFALNVPPVLAEGMIGISAGLAADARNFARQFQERWKGEAPTPNAHYYFDAMLLAGLAYRAAVARTGADNPPTREIGAALVDVSGPGGTIRTWQELRPALEQVESGMDIDYRGTTGPVNFNADGSVPQGTFLTWTLRNGAIEYRSPN